MNISKFTHSIASVSLVFALVMANTSYAQEKPLKKKKSIVSLGLGSIYAPKFSGSDRYKTREIPVILVKYDRLTIGGVRGISYDLYRSKGLKTGLALGYFRGRDESDAEYLRGLGDIKSSANIRIFVRKAFGPIRISANIARDFSADVGGITSAVSAGYSYRATPKFFLNMNIRARWMNDTYAKAVFGISEQQAQVSSLKQTEVKAGFESTTLSLTAVYLMNRRWTLTSIVSTTQYMGDAKQSPITREPNPSMFITSVSYRF